MIQYDFIWNNSDLNRMHYQINNGPWGGYPFQGGGGGYCQHKDANYTTKQSINLSCSLDMTIYSQMKQPLDKIHLGGGGGLNFHSFNANQSHGPSVA